MTTICAISTAVGGAIGIVRVSGPKAIEIVDSIFVSASGRKLCDYENQSLAYGNILTDDGMMLDEVLVSVFRHPHSYTGEDCVEISCHGSSFILQQVVQQLLNHGCFNAQPGEFTKRAFLNGKLSLSEAEGVADMINAETTSQVRNAFLLMSGELTQGIEKAEKELVSAAAYLEAKMDYPEELEEETKPLAKAVLKSALNETERLLKSSGKAKMLNNGINIAIIGIPNAGKSSVLNAILKEDRAIVTPIAGTTRDVIKESVEYKGIKLNFLDTAGIREDGDEIEKIGIDKTKEAIKKADVVLFISDPTREKAEEKEIEELIKDKDVVRLINKSDIKKTDGDGISISAVTGENIDVILDEVLKKCNTEEMDKEGVVTNERHVSALKECKKHLDEALRNYDFAATECTVVDVYAAAEALGKITGRSASDEVVDEIFSTFCVGK